MKTRTQALVIALSAVMLFLSTAAFALTTEELVKLKKAGVTEDIILYMVDANYNDVDRVVKLKGAGYKDETILRIIKSDLKGKETPASPGAADKGGMVSPDVAGETRSEAPPAGNAAVTTASRVKIYWYMLYRGDSVMQNKEAVDNAQISVSGDSIKFEWKPKGGLGLLDMFVKEPFKPPFYWDINKDDILAPGEEGYAFMLKSNAVHKGNPDSDGTHYWVVYLDPKDTRVIDYIKGRIQDK